MATTQVNEFNYSCGYFNLFPPKDKSFMKACLDVICWKMYVLPEHQETVACISCQQTHYGPRCLSLLQLVFVRPNVFSEGMILFSSPF